MQQEKIDNWKKHFSKIFFGLCLVIIFLYILSTFLIPVTVGGILALALSSFLRSIMYKAKLSKSISLIILSFFLIFFITTPFVIFIYRGANALKVVFDNSNMNALSYNIDQLKIKFFIIITKYSNIDQSIINEHFKQINSYFSDYISDFAKTTITQIPEFMVNCFISFLAFIYFITNEHFIKLTYEKYFFISTKNKEKFLVILKKCSRDVFLHNIVTGLAQSLIVAIGSYFTGVGDFYIVFIVCFFTSFLPIPCTTIIGLFLSFLALVNGKYNSSIVMLICAIISGPADNIIKPYLVKKSEVSVNGIITFLSIIGATLKFGLPGVLIGQLVSSLVFGLLPIIFEEYQNET